MGTKFSRNSMKITDIFKRFKEHSLVVDNTYQRRKVWGEKDNIRLIETILMDLVIPEIFLWDADTNPDTGDVVTHIVDGQQRINAIFDYISGNYKLKKKYLLSEEIAEQYGDKYFVELDGETKKNIWSYEMSVINLDKNLIIEDIRKMFYRLNLTDYSLNDQEKRNSLATAFGKISEKLADIDFWEKYKIFSVSDRRRMKDIEYCSSILLLAREGIVDQTKGDKLDYLYEEFSDEYEDAEEDLALVYKAMNMIDELLEGKSDNFVNKKSQMFTIFSVMFEFVRDGITISCKMKNNMKAFALAYGIFKNDMEYQNLNEEQIKFVDALKRYKLASSEGVNKLSNRMIRFRVLKELLEGKLVSSSKIIDEVIITERE